MINFDTLNLYYISNGGLSHNGGKENQKCIAKKRSPPADNHSAYGLSHRVREKAIFL